LVAKKDYNLAKHDDLDVPNLEVIKALQSLTSKGLVKTQFSWQYYYYTVTPEGVEYLREWYAYPYDNDSGCLTLMCLIRLHLPAEIVPATHKKAARPQRPAAPTRGPQRDGESGTYRPPRGERDEYRKKEGAPEGFRPQYAGVGRGAPRE